VKKFIGVLIVFVSFQSQAQKDSSYYHVNIPIEGAITAAGFVTTTILFKRLFRIASMSENDVLALDINDINRFDRPVARFDPVGYDTSQKLSDLSMNLSTALPFFLLIDKKVRQDWGEYLVLYLESQMINTSIYQAGAFSFRRPRPLTYNNEVDMEVRTGEQRSNSFFSGHVSTAATATFFMTKVYTDYHGITGWNRIAFYGAASVPPLFVGYHRMHAGKHFRTDVLLGFVIGAVNGILIPHLHDSMRGKKKQKPRVEF
tara:strand:+ start:210027 stop:210803 length:777 start_codon:yes stop_codon:yes gene_type:complete